MNNNSESPSSVPDQIGGRKPLELDHQGELTDPQAEEDRPAEQTPDDHGDGPITSKRDQEPPY